MNQRILAELSDLESRAELRHLETVQGVDLSSNDYLGLAADPRMKQAILKGVDSATRTASTGSRLLSGHNEAWTALEHNFARWVGAEAALYFTSGYAANIGLLTTILRPGDVVFSDSANHASLIDGIRLAKCRRVIFPHLDLNILEEELRRSASVSGARVIVVESIFSMEGDRAPLADLAALAERYACDRRARTARKRLRGRGGAFRARPRVHAHLRQSACFGRSLCLRLGESAPLAGQSRAHVYFQHGAAAVFRRAGCRRNEPRRGSRRRTRASDEIERIPSERIAEERF